MQLYVDRFNRRDWDGVRDLISADARLNVFDRFAGKVADAPYFATYGRWPWPWKLAVGDVDGEPVVVILKRGRRMRGRPIQLSDFDVIGERIERIVDYIHCPWVIEAAAVVHAHDQP